MADEQNIVIRVLSTGTVTTTHILEAVGDIEPTDSLELSTEPGVMGRIGPKFPNSLSFSIRVRDNDPRTPNYPTARAQHALLRSLMGQLFYLDTRSSPAESITWTLDNVKGMDRNDAKNAWDVQVSARQILGGEFGDLIDPSELTVDTGLVPVSTLDSSLIGIGGQSTNLTFTRAQLRVEGAPFDSVGVAGKELYHLNPLANTFENDPRNQDAVTTVSSGHASDTLLTQQHASLFSPNRVLIYGTKLADVAATEVTYTANVLGIQFTFRVSATDKMKNIFVAVGGSGELFADGVKTICMKPDSSAFVKKVAKEPSLKTDNRRAGVQFPTDLDCIITFAPDRSGRDFVPNNLSHFSLLLTFIGGLAT